MSQAIESSVVVSLDELMRAEEDRIRAENEDRQRRCAEDLAARARAESEQREAERRQFEEERERRRRDQGREREELVRLEAIRTAEVENVRREAEARAREEAIRQTRQTDEHAVIERLYRRLRNVWMALAATIAMATAASVAAMTSVSRQFDKRLGDLTATYTAAGDDWARERNALVLQVNGTEKRYAEARERAENADRDLEALKAKRTEGHAPPIGPKVVPPPPREGPITCQSVCPRGDPLCIECKR
jgi:hypothetical protein